MKAEDYYLKTLLRRDNKISWFLMNKKQTEQKLQNKNEELEKELEMSKENKKIILQFAKILKISGKTIKEIQIETKLSKNEIEKL